MFQSSRDGFTSPYDAHRRFEYEGDAVILPDVIDDVEKIAIFPVWVLHSLGDWKYEVSSGYCPHVLVNPSNVSEMSIQETGARDDEVKNEAFAQVLQSAKGSIALDTIF